MLLGRRAFVGRLGTGVAGVVVASGATADRSVGQNPPRGVAGPTAAPRQSHAYIGSGMFVPVAIRDRLVALGLSA